MASREAPTSRRHPAKPLTIAAIVCVVLAASPFLRLPFLYWLVGAFAALSTNGVDMTLAGFAVFALHSILPLVGAFLADMALRRSEPRTRWRTTASVLRVLGAVGTIVYLFAWCGAAFVETLPWQIDISDEIRPLQP
jgi:hypothetical protein